MTGMFARVGDDDVSEKFEKQKCPDATSRWTVSASLHPLPAAQMLVILDAGRTGISSSHTCCQIIELGLSNAIRMDISFEKNYSFCDRSRKQHFFDAFAGIAPPVCISTNNQLKHFPPLTLFPFLPSLSPPISFQVLLQLNIILLIRDKRHGLRVELVQAGNKQSSVQSLGRLAQHIRQIVIPHMAQPLFELLGDLARVGAHVGRQPLVQVARPAAARDEPLRALAAVLVKDGKHHLEVTRLLDLGVCQQGREDGGIFDAEPRACALVRRGRVGGVADET